MRFTLLFVLLSVLPCTLPGQQPCTVETLAGDFIGPPPGDGGPGVLAELVSPFDVQVGPDGAVYISDTSHRVIRRVGVDGVISTIAGTGARGFGGDGGPAVSALLSSPASMAFGPDGSLYFKDSSRVRRVDPDGGISTFAGNGGFGVPELGVAAVSTPVGGFTRIVVGSNGVLYAASASAHRVYSVGTDGVLRLVAGRGTDEFGRASFGGDGGAAVDALLDTPSDVAVDSENRVYILDRNNRRIRRVDANGLIDTYVGGVVGALSPVGTAREEVVIQLLSQIEVDALDRLYWPEREAIRRLPLDGTLETSALLPDGQRSYFFSVSDDGRTLLNFQAQTWELGDDGSRKLVAGTGLTGPRGEGGPARRALIGSIDGLAANEAGEIFYSDLAYLRVRKIAIDGRMERVAGSGSLVGVFEDGAPALETPLEPGGVAVDDQGRVLIAELRGRVSRVEADGSLSWIAGLGIPIPRCPNNDCGDGGQARDATLIVPFDVVADSLGNLYVREQRRHDSPVFWVRRISPDGVISTVKIIDPSDQGRLSAGEIAISPDNRLVVATAASGSGDELWSLSPDDEQMRIPGYAGFFRAARVIAVHPNGEFYIAENFGSFIRRLDSEGRSHDVTGAQSPGSEAGDRTTPEVPNNRSIADLAFTPDGDLLISDGANRRLLRIRDVAACPDDPRPQLAIGAWRNGASFSTALSPGTIFSVFGKGMGTMAGVLAGLSDGEFPTSIQGTRVLFDGVPAALIFAQDGQISGIVPWATPISRWEELPFRSPQIAGPAELIVERNGIQSRAGGWNLTDASPGFFTLDSSGSGLAAALNQDGTINGPLNPAPNGSVIVLFGTGFGLLDPPGVDGRLSSVPLSSLLSQPTVQIAGQTADVLYAGPAPGLVSGVIQLNVRVPNDASGAPAVIATVGEADSARVSVVVGQ